MHDELLKWSAPPCNWNANGTQIIYKTGIILGTLCRFYIFIYEYMFICGIKQSIIQVYVNLY